MRGSRISGMGHYVPERVVTNHDLAKIIDTSDEWIVQRTGIEERRWVEGNVGSSDLAFEAAKDALEDAGIAASDLDMIIFATLSPDVNFPGSSCILQKKLLGTLWMLENSGNVFLRCVLELGSHTSILLMRLIGICLNLLKIRG